MIHSESVVIESIRRWISSIVIGLNLCPFAQRVFQADLIRYVVSDAADPEVLRFDLASELESLAASPIGKCETTLLIHPQALLRFDDYLDFLPEVDRLIKIGGYCGVIQVASFHPEYQFAGTAAEDVENYTNRSPYPMLHLLREESVPRVAANPDELLHIPTRNMATLRQLGLAGIQNLLESHGCRFQEKHASRLSRWRAAGRCCCPHFTIQ